MSAWRLEKFKKIASIAEDAQAPLPNTLIGKLSLTSYFRAMAAIALSIFFLLLYIFRHRAGFGQGRLPRAATRMLALHGEVSTRTTHILRAVNEVELSQSAIIIIGRSRYGPKKVAKIWEKKLSYIQPGLLPVYLPMSPMSCFAAFAKLPGVISEGLSLLCRGTIKMSLRDEMAIAFRVFLGVISEKWWAQQSVSCEVIFGITGTADSALLERAIKRSGGRSVHAVHGQATGPNFLGFSDLALFRSRHDARAYAELGVYGVCSVQEALPVDARRGSAGLLLLSNLAHPMNPGFQRFGLRDEIALLNAVGEAARMLGPRAHPLRWKPHPAIDALPIEAQDELRTTAKALGFVELGVDADIEQVATSCLWVVSSPSTVALDLLQAGVLSVLLDPQGSLLDTAIRCLPVAPADGAELKKTLLSLIENKEYSKQFIASWKLIGPARPLDLKHALQ